MEKKGRSQHNSHSEVPEETWIAIQRLVNDDDEVGLYIKQAVQELLLTEPQETALGNIIQNSLKNPSPETQQKAKQARKKLASANTRLVIAIAKKYITWGVPFNELIQEGNEGLMKATKNFDPQKGRFTTWATPWINQSIKRYVFSKIRTIKIPLEIGARITEIRSFSSIYRQLNGAYPNAAQLAKHFGETEEEIEFLLSISQDVESLEQPEDDNLPLLERIEDSNSPSPEDLTELSIDIERMYTVLDRLDKRKRQVLILRFGLFDQGPHTLEEVGAKIGVSKERVRQLEEKALSDLRILLLKEEKIKKTVRAKQ